MTVTLLHVRALRQSLIHIFPKGSFRTFFLVLTHMDPSFFLLETTPRRFDAQGWALQAASCAEGTAGREQAGPRAESGLGSCRLGTAWPGTQRTEGEGLGASSSPHPRTLYAS